MESSFIQNDKVLLSVFVTVLVGFVTAALSIVRLVNDKESKTTDYRQAWTDSLRKCFADLISNINLLAGTLVSRQKALDHVNKILRVQPESDKETLPPALENVRVYLDKQLHDHEAHVRDLRRNLHQSYALSRLHFKPNDLSFARVEQKFDLVLELLDKLSSLDGEASEPERATLREKVHGAAGDITAFSRDILKTEWEAVKRGEPAYQRTKLWSLGGGAVALAILAIFGLVTTWHLLRAAPNSSLSASKTQPPSLDRSQNFSTTLLPADSLARTSPVQTTQTVNVYSEPHCPPRRTAPPTDKPVSQACPKP